MLDDSDGDNGDDGGDAFVALAADNAASTSPSSSFHKPPSGSAVVVPLYAQVARFRRSRRGKVLREVSERYLRQDLGFGLRCNRPHEKKPSVIGSASELAKLLEATTCAAPAGADDDNDNGEDDDSTPDSSPPRHRHRPMSELVVVDTNVILHNLDVLEQASNLPHLPLALVVPQTSLLEARRHSIVAYERAVALLHKQRRQRDQNHHRPSGGQEAVAAAMRPEIVAIYFPDVHHAETATDENEMKAAAALTAAATITTNAVTANDVNDARIRRVAEFYARNLPKESVLRVVYLSDDAASRRELLLSGTTKSSEEDTIPIGCPLIALTVRQWIRDLEENNPRVSLSDFVAQLDSSAPPRHHQRDGESPEDGPASEPFLFPPHWDAAALSRGVQSGACHRGVLRCLSTEIRFLDDDEGGDDHGGGVSRSASSTSWVTIRRGEERVAVTIQGMKDRNRAVDGDVVAIALNPIERWISATSVASESPVHGAGVTDGLVETDGAINDSAGIAGDTAAPTLSEIENVQDHFDVQARSLRPTGRVVGILRRNFPTSLIGSIGGNQSAERRDVASRLEREHEDGTATCVFFPVDSKRHPPILIRTLQRDRLLGQRIAVAMDSWPADSPYPLGHYVRSLGQAGAKEVETQVLLEQHSIPYEPFSASVLSCLPPVNYEITYTADRTDLRHLPVLSIDPPNCKDIDDALHCVTLPSGNLQVGVHIADVTHYVKAGSAMDLEAANRSTSTYLVNQRLDMLPGLLTTDLCSLKSNVDRYAFSVLWEVTPQAEIVKVDFCKSIIHSIAALTYQQAQSMIEQPYDASDVQSCAVKDLASLALLFRQRRIEAGALTLASPEVKFILDSESLNPTDVQAYALLEANALVEEFMLLANVTVSKKILRHYPTLSVLRRHPSPNRAMFDGLISKAKCRGLQLDIEDSKRLADSLDAAVDPSDPYINKLLRILSTRCMSPAQYFCSGEVKAQDWHHYGLAAPVYTHFTSPIRRYADVCVHRLLAAAIGVAPLPSQFTKPHLHDLCANMNRRHRAAQLAGRASVLLHTLIFFAGDGAREEDAYVLDVSASSKDPSLTVMVPRYGIEGNVRLPIDAGDPDLELMPELHKISYRQGSFQVQVFDKVRVRIWVREFDDNQRELVVDLVSPIASECGGQQKRPKPSPPGGSGENRQKKARKNS